MQELSDEQLMKKYASGNAAAFETLYQRYRGSLYRYLQRQVSDDALANDLYQGSWEKVINARSRYRSSSPFKAWLFTIARNHMIDHFRSQRSTNELDEGKAIDPSESPGEALLRTEKHQNFLSHLAQLPAEQKDTLLLRFETGLGLEAIGEVTGVPAETVKSRLRYATRKLKQALSS